MDSIQKTGLMEILNESVNFDVDMGAYSGFRTGGKADAVCIARNLSSLKRLISFMADEAIPWLTVGKGSNLLVGDGGIRGAVIVLKGELAGIRKECPETLIAGGGLSNVKLLKFCIQQGLAGMEFLAGIPGTVGGAVMMNAGAYGEDIGARVQSVSVVTPEGDAREIDRPELSFEYRRAEITDKSVVYSVTLGLRKGTENSIRERIELNLNNRKLSQPLDMPSCGSVFKNPRGKFAGKLIEESGLKGMRIGDAMISARHANFIVNAGNAKASDILRLIDYVKKKVSEDTGIELETEIKVVGQ